MVSKCSRKRFFEFSSLRDQPLWQLVSQGRSAQTASANKSNLRLIVVTPHTTSCRY